MEIITTKITKPPIICIYGQHGVGKSTFAASCPAPIFIRTEDRHEHLEVKAFPLSESLDHVQKCLQFLLDTKHDFKTVVIDTLDWLQPLIFKKVCEDYNVQDIGDKKVLGFGRGYLVAEEYLNDRILKPLTMLRNEKKMMPLLISHFAVEYIDDTQGNAYQKYNLDLQGSRLRPRIHEFCDIVGFMEYKNSSSQFEVKGGEKATKISYSGQVALRLRPQPYFEAKQSYGLPASIDIKEGEGWEALSAELKKNIKPKRKGNLTETKEDKKVVDLNKLGGNENGKSELRQ